MSNQFTSLLNLIFSKKNLFLTLAIAAFGLTLMLLFITKNGFLIPIEDKYLYDNQTGIYHNLKNDSFSITLSAGIHNKRFSLRFAAESLKIAKNVANSGIAISFANNNNSLNISNNNSKTTIEKVYLFNLLGQRIASWDVENQTNLQIPIQKISQGTYIVKVKTSNGVTSSKIIID